MINKHFRSFHLEVLAWQILNGITISDYSSGVRYFFDKGRDEIAKKTADPAGYSDDVGFYIDTREKIDEAVSRLTTAYNRAIKAEAYEKEGKPESAIDEWRKVFGSSFPAYG